MCSVFMHVVIAQLQMHLGTITALFQGPSQLSIACSTEKRGEPGIFFHVSMT